MNKMKNRKIVRRGAALLFFFLLVAIWTLDMPFSSKMWKHGSTEKTFDFQNTNHGNEGKKDFEAIDKFQKEIVFGVGNPKNEEPKEDKHIEVSNPEDEKTKEGEEKTKEGEEKTKEGESNNVNDSEEKDKKVALHGDKTDKKSDSLITDSDLQTFNKAQEKSEKVDYLNLGEMLRVFSKFHKVAIKEGIEKMTLEEKDFYEKIEKELFLWTNPAFTKTVDLHKSFSGNGIVICIGNGQAKMALATLRMIRNVHKSTLPIEVFYIGEGDLNQDNRKLLESLPDTKTVDIKTKFDDSILELGGWAIKPFALLASSFQNAMLIDADVVFLQNPEVLFASHLFKKYGALFFHDRTLYSHEERTKQWFQDLMKKPQSEYSKGLRVFNDKTAHEQESGVVLIDKQKNMVALLATCSLNVGAIRKSTYDFVFGDKETFWLGFETVGAEYRFNGFFPGTVGESQKTEKGKNRICARQILHLDENQVPMWINGGIQESKYDSSSPLVTFNDYIMEPGSWQLKGGNMACIETEREAMVLSPILLEVAKENGEMLMDTLAGK